MASNNPHTSVYMRGLYDGFRIGNEEGMTPSKHKMLLNQQTAVAKKVFEHIPTAAPATTESISTSIIRAAQFRVDMKTLAGVLDGLKDAGLVKESPRGSWTRVIPREPITLHEPLPVGIVSQAAERIKEGGDPIAVAKVAQNALDAGLIPNAGCNLELANDDPIIVKTPAETFGEMAQHLRQRAHELLSMANEMDTAALAFEQRLEDSDKRLARFNQLRALLTEA